MNHDDSETNSVPGDSGGGDASLPGGGVASLPGGGDARLRPTERIQTSGEFRRIKDRGCRFRTENLRINYLPTRREQSRLGLVVSRRHGHAVARTRIKRLLREAFRLTKHELPTPHDLVLLPSGRPPPLSAYIESLRHFCAYLHEKQARSSASKPASKPAPRCKNGVGKESVGS
jgi:ribonuclease P protein component